jgi:hypothetical protein
MHKRAVWSPASSTTPTSRFETIVSYQNHLLVGGFFTTINGSTAYRYDPV